MVCGKSNRNISFNQFYIFDLTNFNYLPPCLSFWLSFLLLKTKVFTDFQICISVPVMENFIFRAENLTWSFMCFWSLSSLFSSWLSKRTFKAMVWSPFIDMNCIEANKIFLILRFFISLWATKAFSRPCYATYCVANLMEILLVVPENYSGGSYLNHRPFS